MQPCRKRSKTSRPQKDAASPEKLAVIDDDIAAFQEIYDMVVTEAAKWRKPLPAMQANVDAAQAKYDEAHNRTSGLQAELNKAIDDGASNETIKQLQSEIMSAERREKSCEDDLHHCHAGSKARKDRFSVSKVRRRKPKPTSMRM